ncbi:malonate decarboxylase holo-ACP synthase [Paraburkholderia sp. MMS20-SJTR3]|uniref:Malonate decarboxylase holo-ACP synthase n=1 Tax=Paraburkholderia sejongensis TaxID=2886946 RepID=A0ABS8K3T5_9BURK|nr:malonate decarboxylase holo-ACP synthase [Paraburkholderia sp. MMS20-SJTR3]MCC8396564.1 malonate decarboxylase holo-ACP synthase [Paraburkholderia sp. MMS20-SJTR3]
MRVCAAPPFADTCGDLRAAATEEAAGTARWRPHDLLHLHCLRSFDGEPAWVRDAFARARYAVVRRALAADGFIAVGMRGGTRAQRYGTWAHADDIVDAVSPEALAQLQPSAERAELPCFAALASLQQDAQGPLARFVWGPTGSAGFELATHLQTVTEASDLDLLIRAPQPLALELARALLEQLQTVATRLGMRIDAQLETPAGGVALVEWAAGKARVLARAASGPSLLADPWAAVDTHGGTA